MPPDRKPGTEAHYQDSSMYQVDGQNEVSAGEKEDLETGREAGQTGKPGDPVDSQDESTPIDPSGPDNTGNRQRSSLQRVAGALRSGFNTAHELGALNRDVRHATRNPQTGKSAIPYVAPIPVYNADAFPEPATTANSDLDVGLDISDQSTTTSEYSPNADSTSDAPSDTRTVIAGMKEDSEAIIKDTEQRLADAAPIPDPPSWMQPKEEKSTPNPEPGQPPDQAEQPEPASSQDGNLWEQPSENAFPTTAGETSTNETEGETNGKPDNRGKMIYEYNPTAEQTRSEPFRETTEKSPEAAVGQFTEQEQQEPIPVITTEQIKENIDEYQTQLAGIQTEIETIDEKIRLKEREIAEMDDQTDPSSPQAQDTSVDSDPEMKTLLSRREELMKERDQRQKDLTTSLDVLSNFDHTGNEQPIIGPTDGSQTATAEEIPAETQEAIQQAGIGNEILEEVPSGEEASFQKKVPASESASPSETTTSPEKPATVETPVSPEIQALREQIQALSDTVKTLQESLKESEQRFEESNRRFTELAEAVAATQDRIPQPEIGETSEVEETAATSEQRAEAAEDAGSTDNNNPKNGWWRNGQRFTKRAEAVASAQDRTPQPEIGETSEVEETAATTEQEAEAAEDAGSTDNNNPKNGWWRNGQRFTERAGAVAAAQDRTPQPEISETPEVEETAATAEQEAEAAEEISDEDGIIEGTFRPINPEEDTDLTDTNEQETPWWKSDRAKKLYAIATGVALGAAVVAGTTVNPLAVVMTAKGASLASKIGSKILTRRATKLADRGEEEKATRNLLWAKRLSNYAGGFFSGAAWGAGLMGLAEQFIFKNDIAFLEKAADSGYKTVTGEGPGHDIPKQTTGETLTDPGTSGIYDRFLQSDRYQLPDNWKILESARGWHGTNIYLNGTEEGEAFRAMINYLKSRNLSPEMIERVLGQGQNIPLGFHDAVRNIMSGMDPQRALEAAKVVIGGNEKMSFLEAIRQGVQSLPSVTTL